MIIETPIDVEFALAQDLAESLPPTWDVAAWPAPDDMDGSTAVVRTSLVSTAEETPVSIRYTVVLDLWLGHGDRYDEAVDAAIALSRAVASLPFEQHESGRDWKMPSIVAAPQPMADPDHPDIPRVRQSWSIGVRGIPIF